jgi:hypothetical protein
VRISIINLWLAQQPTANHGAPQNNHVTHNSSANTCDLLSDPSGEN